MDADLENTHSSLQQVGLPSTIEDLKSPTEEYVVKVIKTFLTKFFIDANLISKPILEQQQVLLHSDNSNLIGLINLHIVMEEICNRTYTPQLCIIDITTPGQKKTRIFLKFLTNFIFYTSNKELEFQDRVDQIHKEAEEYNKMVQQKNEMRSEINDTAVHKGKLLSLKEKYENEIKETLVGIKGNNKMLFQQSKEITGIKEKKEEVLEVYETLKAQAAQSEKEIEELESEIVKSPEKCKADLERLEEEYKLKLEERETILEAFQEKEKLFEQREKIVQFVKKHVDELSEKSDLYKQLKIIIMSTNEQVEQQIEALKSTAAKWEHDVALQEEQCKTTETYDIETQCHQKLASLRNQRKQLLSAKKLVETRLGVDKQEYNEVYFNNNDAKNLVNKLEEDVCVFLRDCQELFDSEVSTDKEIWQLFRDT